jgi:acyl carrier protein
MNGQPDIEKTVSQVIGEIVGTKRKFTLSSELIEDLKISSDDLSMYFVPQLERRLSVKVTIDEWSTVRTVSDACNILNRYVHQKKVHPPRRGA